MEKQLTVKELYLHIRKAMLKDPSIAKKYIVVGNDTEGNGFHGLLFGLTTETDDVKDIIEFSNGLSDSETDANNLVILG